MPTAKAEFNAPPSFSALVATDAPCTTKDFSDQLRAELQAMFGQATDEEQPVEGAPAAEFAETILAEARWAIGEIADARLSLTKQSLRAECESVLRRAQELSQDLRRLSPDLDELLGADTDPLGTADILDALSERMKAALGVIGGLRRNMRPDETYHAIVLEMAIRVLRVTRDFGLPVAATCGSYLRVTHDVTEDYGAGDDGESQYISVAVELLAAIGRDLGRMFSEPGLALSNLSWRDIVRKAKADVSDEEPEMGEARGEGSRTTPGFPEISVDESGRAMA